MTLETTRQSFRVTAYGRTIGLTRDDAAFALPYLPVDWSEDAPDQAVDRRYTVTRQGIDQWSVDIAGEHQLDVDDPESVTSTIEGDLHHWLATYTRGYLFVHAGCVGWRGRAIVVPGRSFAGKTTLTCALLDAGADYYSDDYAVIDPDGRIHPFPRRLQLRPDPPGPAMRIDPASGDWNVGHEPIRAALVANVKYDADAGWKVEEVSKGAGALALLDNTVAARERPRDALRIMTNAMESARAIQGTRDDAATTATRLLALVDEIEPA